MATQAATHGLTRDNAKHPLYGLWKRMRQRCNDSQCDDYPDYGARGIRVCERWSDFAAFVADMGPRPSKNHSLDRFPDPNGNYEPGNVRWASPTQQARNAPRNNVLTARQAAIIKARHATGESPHAIANSLSVPFTAVKHVAYGETWQDVSADH